jgi:hypothetical protein
VFKKKLLMSHIYGFFVWLLNKQRKLINSADNLARNNWPHNASCPMCDIKHKKVRFYDLGARTQIDTY